MADYLLEVGCEEIPATMIEKALADLDEGLSRKLDADGLKPTGPSVRLGGPRRFAVILAGIPPQQPDRSVRLTGPPADKAFDAEGRPTKAALGFAHKLGIDPSRLERVETAKGTVVAGVMATKGLTAAAVLANIVPEVLAGLSFRKMMRWGSRDVRFVRPVRSLVSLLDDEVVPFDFAGVEAGRESFGHRFLGARRVAIAAVGEYVKTLAGEHVVASGEERRRVLAVQLRDLAAAAGGVADADPELLDEVTHFVEEPHAFAGRFDAGFLDLPAEVLVTSMKHHQKSFPVWRENGTALAPAFLAVANVPDREGHIARGYERVLNARLADARFFWSEDRKVALADRVARLAKVTFHEKLGSYGRKAERLGELSRATAHHFAGSERDGDIAAAAARLAKADLTTGMVGEFPELQGITGGLYLRAEGADEAVAAAVYEHYRPISFEGALPQTWPGMALAIADKLDTLVGCFGAGLIPSGTRDPFGLRRAAQGVVRIVLERNREGDLAALLETAAHLHERHPGAAHAPTGLPALRTWLGERLEHALREEHHRPDTVAAVLEVSPLDFVSARRRAQALSDARALAGFEEIFTVFKRVANIAGSGEVVYTKDLLTEPAEVDLEVVLERVAERAREAASRRAWNEVLEQARELAQPLHRFFADVMVMVPDEALRNNRLGLLRAIGRVVAPIGDFSKLQVEREGKA